MQTNIDFISAYTSSRGDERMKAEDIIVQLNDSREFLFNVGQHEEAFEAMDQTTRLRASINLFEIENPFLTSHEVGI